MSTLIQKQLLRRKAKQDSVCAAVLDELRANDWEPGLTKDSYSAIVKLGFYRKTLSLAFVATDVLAAEQPNTLRQLLYRLVSLNWLPSTDEHQYEKLGRAVTTLREGGVVPFAWIVDHMRNRLKPSSWSGLADFGETVRGAYRKNFWEQLPAYVEIFVEKDAIAGVLQEVTEDYDVTLTPVRGFVSLSTAHVAATIWSDIDKPIFVYYLGDHDPSGLAIETTLRDKLERYCSRPFTWRRLGLLPEDFEAFNLRRLPLKKKDARTKAFVAAGYTFGGELDALPAAELRKRVRDATTSHIPSGEWERLQRIEALERETVERAFGQLGGRMVKARL